MSDVIQLLPDSVANQIAAGEVIQRPASVIKELVENAIDAGATQVKIILRDAGKTLIQVVDNGCGMSDTDARLAFERHATSKIRQASDLFELHTMGFRGEALPSIAAVAQVDLLTMQRDAQLGTHLEIAASKFVSQTPEACTPGTNLSVKNLFFNFPARRKFLKKDAVEIGHITREFERLALVNPTVEFELYHNDINLYQLLPGTLRQRIAGLFGKAIDKQLIPVETETPLVKINGFISRPEFARKRNQQQFFFVNGRNMRHPYFHKAILSCYEELIDSEHQPNYFINFDVDPQTIDVNIHPTKSEIKFENEQPIWQILSAAVREALGKFNAIPALDFDQDDAPEIPVFDPSMGGNLEIDLDGSFNPFDTSTPKAKSKLDSSSEYINAVEVPSRLTTGAVSRIGSTASSEATHSSSLNRASHLNDWDKLYADFQGATNPIANGSAPTPESFLSAHADLPSAISESAINALPGMETATPSAGGLLQLANRFLVTFDHNGLIVVDRHRAHVKVLYDRFLHQSATSVGETQQVLFAELIELTPLQKGTLDSIADEVKALGYELQFSQSVDEGIFRCEMTGVPAVLGNANAAEALLKIIDDATEETAKPQSDIHSRLALSLAQSAAIRANQTQQPAEAERLLADLFALPDPAYTPDGHPIILQLPLSEITRRLS
jgi:DNA mismatch repair protein MutL